MSRLRVILSGQKSFGCTVFDMLRKRNDTDLIAVYAPKGDKLSVAAGMYGVQYYRAGELRSDRLPDGVDLIICAHSYDFISNAVRSRLRLGAISYHPSLLPLHRGRDAIRWTIRDGDRITGGSVFWLTDTVDGGPIAAQEWCHVRPDDDEHSIWRRELFPMGVRLLSSVLDDVSRGILVMRDQDKALATWEPSFSGAPRLFRPELPQIGELTGYRIIK